MFQELWEKVSDVGVFTESVRGWLSGISINSVIILIMMIFMIVGAVDKLRGNKLGYGQEFDEGFRAMGPLAIAMAGVVAAAPVLAAVLEPIIVPVYRLLGADGAMFAGTLLACDMGGYPLAQQLAQTEAAANFSGLILGTMMGATLVFTIPVALSIIKPEDRAYLGAGTLAGLITIPIGCIAGGLVMSMTAYPMDILAILRNLIPVILIAALIVLGLWFAPAKMIAGFNHFGAGVTAVITVFTAIAVFQYQTGIRFPLFNLMVEAESEGGLVPLEEGLLVCGQIAVVLIGAFPMVKWITRTFGKALGKLGKALGMNESGSAGLVATLANNIAMFNIFGEMNEKGKLLNVAFAVGASFVFGDHLGFTAGVNQDMIFPMIVGKVVAGVTALILCSWLSPKLLSKIQDSKQGGKK